jgi:tetratricopeptide (TPR) repeat protein
MRNKILKTVAVSSALLVVLSAVALAQTAQIEGNVKVKAADGTMKPVEGALIQIHRTDIKGNWDVKTDKKGHYIRLGMPVQGTFTVIVTGPGMQPTWATGVRLLSGAPIDFVAEPGEGQTLTPEQLQSLLAKPKGGGGPPGPGGSGPPPASAADRAKAAQQEKELAEKRKEGEALQGAYNDALARYKQGVELMKTSNYQGALSEFEAAAGVDPGKHEAFAEVAYKANANVAEAHYQLGVDLFNNKKRDEAKVHFQKAVEAIDKSLAVLTTLPPEKNPNLNNDLITYYNIRSKNAMLLIEHFGVVDLVEPSIKMIEKVETIDTTGKNRWAVLRGDVYRFSGRSDEAIAAYKNAITTDPTNVDALYGLGLTLIAASEKEKIQEGANALADFVAKAPATDKRVADVKAALEAVKEAYKVEAEKPARRRGRP